MRQVGVCRRPVFNSSMSSVRNAHYPSTCRNPGGIPVANPAEDWRGVPKSGLARLAV
jgi:hypothetical protein